MFTFGAMSLGTQVRKYRTALGLTLEQLSERAQVDVGTISALENRGSNRSQFGVAIARGLGLTLEQVLDESRDWLQEAKQPTASESHSPAAHQSGKGALGAQPIPWPFDHVSRTQWDTLGEKERGLVEGFAKGLLHTKSPSLRNKKDGTNG